jgi:hypothetical protein
MIRKLIAAAAFAAVLAPAALAQPPADAPKFSVKTSTIGQILDNEAAKAAFTKALPEVAAAPQLQDAREMTLDAVSQMAPDYFPADKMKELEAELAKIK